MKRKEMEGDVEGDTLLGRWTNPRWMGGCHHL